MLSLSEDNIIHYLVMTMIFLLILCIPYKWARAVAAIIFVIFVSSTLSLPSIGMLGLSGAAITISYLLPGKYGRYDDEGYFSRNPKQ